jgi:hypothetical protein
MENRKNKEPNSGYLRHNLMRRKTAIQETKFWIYINHNLDEMENIDTREQTLYI